MCQSQYVFSGEPQQKHRALCGLILSTFPPRSPYCIRAHKHAGTYIHTHTLTHRFYNYRIFEKYAYELPNVASRPSDK
jgi:hypothetical protein